MASARLGCDEALRLYEDGKADWEPLPDGLHVALVLVDNTPYNEIEGFDEGTVMRVVEELRAKGVSDDRIEVQELMEVRLVDADGNEIPLEAPLQLVNHYHVNGNRLEYSGYSELECI